MEENLTPEEYGKRAYKNGLAAAWQDEEFLKTLDSEPTRTNVKKLDSWIKGWTKAHFDDHTFSFQAA